MIFIGTWFPERLPARAFPAFFFDDAVLDIPKNKPMDDVPTASMRRRDMLFDTFIHSCLIIKDMYKVKS